MHILIVEDEFELSEDLGSVLESENYTVETSNNGEQALEKIWNENHDLILLAVMLPKLNGLEVLQTARDAGISTPILMLTAKGALQNGRCKSH